MNWFKRKKHQETPMRKEIEIRGHRFASENGYIYLKDLASLYFVFKALDGDPLAKELLDKAGAIVTDADGKRVYPK